MIKEQDESPKTELVPTSQRDIEITSWLGYGGFSQVYLGKWKNNIVAIKQLTGITEAIESEFLSEVHVMWKYGHHPKLVQLLSVCKELNYYAMILEYMKNGTLHNLLHNQNQLLPWTRKYQIIIDISEGLKFLHEHGIVHGDIKTANILFDKDWVAKIADFGGSKIKLYGSNASITIVGRRVGGTLNYLAPELLKKLKQTTYGFKFKEGTKTNYASDMYSYGMVIWAITTRREPFLHVVLGNFADFKKFILDTKAGEILNPETRPKLREIIEKCCSHVPNDRFVITEALSQIESEYNDVKNKIGKKQEALDEIIIEAYNKSLDKFDKVLSICRKFAEVDIKLAAIAYASLLNEMQKNNHLDEIELFKLAYSIKEVMEFPHYSKINEVVKNQFNELKKKLPCGVQNMLWKESIILENESTEKGLTAEHLKQNPHHMVSQSCIDQYLMWKPIVKEAGTYFLLKNETTNTYLDAGPDHSTSQENPENNPYLRWKVIPRASGTYFWLKNNHIKHFLDAGSNHSTKQTNPNDNGYVRWKIN